MTATLSWNRRILKTLFNFELPFWLFEIDEPTTTKKIRECGSKETQLSLILVIIASCLIFPINICEFCLYEKLIEMRGNYVLICKGNKSLIPPCILIHNPLAF